MNRLRQRLHVVATRGDAGFTLVEGIVAMTIFVTILSLMSSVMMAMTENMRLAEGVSVATDQTRIGFQRLDKQVRYADGFRPLSAGGDWAVAFRLAEDTDAASPHYTCHEWQVDPATDRLQTRSWPEPGGGSSSAQPWRTVAVGVVNATADPPFRPASSLKHQGMTVELLTQRGKDGRGTAHLKSTFFARNSDATLPTSVCL